MTDAELQTEETGTTEVIETGSGAESATAAEPQAPEGFIKAEDAQKDINKQHRKYRDEERARKKIEAEAERLRKENEELKASTVDTTVPPVPDRYDDDYEEKIRLRDEAIQRKTAHDEKQKRLDADRQRNEEAQAKQEKEAIDAKIATFDSNMVQLGLNPVEVKEAADTLIGYGISDAVQDVLLDDAEGPLMVKYLANNPIELEALGGMSVMQLAKHVNEDIRPKASLLKPQTSKAPDPPTTLSGGGVREMDDPLIKGATFE